MRRFLVPLAIGVIGAALLVALGVWQLQRLDWKLGILADLQARMAADPVPVPQDPDPVADRYLPVRATGTTGAQELHVLVSTRAQGAGFRIVTPFALADGRTVLLDRGFVPTEAKGADRPPRDLTVTGNLHWPDERDRFTPDNDRAANYWYAREVDVMAAALDTRPVMIVARTTSSPDPAVTPLPLDISGIPNNHLGYAVQWFGLALVWLAMTALWIRRIARRSA